ncbi:NAD-dependent epimerase/dehydratase family protein [Patescibacteria group bacterium]|nr:NAD-dependent epimerase/dehydratase family protein [Patescibacteria group bacterium]
MKILVTGGAGFIGSHLVDKLIAKNHRVVIVDNLAAGKKEFLNKKAKFYKLDIVNPGLNKIFKKEKPEIVFHLAAQKSVPYSLKYPLEDASINVLGSVNVIENSLSAKVKKLIFTSTGGAIYGQTKLIPSPESTPENPDSPYGLNKLTVDKYLKNYYSRVKNLNYVSLRLANVYGPRQDPAGEAGVVAIFINNLLKNKQCFINGSGQQTRDFVYVGDVVDSCIKSINKGQGIYNIGTSQETSINQLYQMISKLIADQKARHRKAIPGEVFRSVLKSNKAKRELSWESKIDLKSGIKRTTKYFQEL